MVGALVTLFGDPIEAAIDEYFDWLALAFIALLIVGAVVLRVVTRQRRPASGAAE